MSYIFKGEGEAPYFWLPCVLHGMAEGGRQQASSWDVLIQGGLLWCVH